jgi:hypothetical protein
MLILVISLACLYIYGFPANHNLLQYQRNSSYPCEHDYCIFLSCYIVDSRCCIHAGDDRIVSIFFAMPALTYVFAPLATDLSSSKDHLLLLLW